MPMYEYLCRECSAVFELILPADTTGYAKCQKCGGVSDRQLCVANFKINGHSEANGYNYQKGTTNAE
jgi:putative FmdB family regulatory protein